MCGSDSIATRFIRGTFAFFALVQIVLNAENSFAQLTIPNIPDIPDIPNVSDFSEIPATSAEVTPAPFETPLASPGQGYWIVSTWSSPQSFDGAPLRFCDEVQRFDECIGHRDSSLAELTQSLIPGVPVCIVVHGSFMDSPSVIPESCSTWRWLKAGSCGRPFQMIYFSWPSDRPLSPLACIDVAVLGNRASRNGFYLASLVQHVPPECPISLIGHSHGTRVISSSLHLMAGGTVDDSRHPYARATGRRIRTVFAASAIDHDWLNPGQRFDRALCSTECLLNLRNDCDPALRIYPLRHIGSSRALGCSGFTAKDHKKLGSWNTRVRDLDVSEQIGAAHLWPNYVSQVWLARRLSNYLYFSDLQPM
jgi:hypothetical protein